MEKMITRRLDFEECQAVRMGDNGPETIGYVRVKGTKDPDGVAFVRVVNTFTAMCSMNVSNFAALANKIRLEPATENKEDENND